jgi:hypothetical protein
MATTQPSIQLEDQLALRIEKEVRQQMDDILENIQTIATEYEIASKDKKSPFRNVLAVAVESSSSLEVIKNYIRYQVGRGGNSSPIWSLRRKQDQKLFAQELVDALSNLSQDVDQIIARTKASLEPSDQKDINKTLIPEQNELLDYLRNEDNQKIIKRKLHLELAQLYLGYLAREHTAQVGEKETENNSSKDKESNQKRQASKSRPPNSRKPKPNKR